MHPRRVASVDVLLSPFFPRSSHLNIRLIATIAKHYLQVRTSPLPSFANMSATDHVCAAASAINAAASLVNTLIAFDR